MRVERSVLRVIPSDNREGCGDGDILEPDGLLFLLKGREHSGDLPAPGKPQGSLGR